MNGEDISEIKQRLASIETHIKAIYDRLDRTPAPGVGPICQLNKEEIRGLKAAVGRQTLIATVLGAVGGAIVLLIKTWGGR